MLKKLFTSCLAVCALTTGIVQAILPERVPNEFTVKERWLSWTTDFDIETKQFKLGYVHRKLFSLAIEYDLHEMDDSLLAKARMRWFSWGATFDVEDNFEIPLGRVEEKIFTFFPTFEIISPKNEVLAIAKMNFWGTTYTLRDPVTSEPLATLSRPFFRLKDNWTAKIVNPELFHQKQIDPRLFIILMAFQTDRDTWTQAQMANNSVEWKDNYGGRKLFSTDEPEEQEDLTEEDLKQIDLLTTRILTEAEENEPQVVDEQKRLQKGTAILRSLLESEALSPTQKNALHHLLNGIQ